MQEQDIKQIQEAVRGVVKEEVNRRVEVSENVITSTIADGFQDVQNQLNDHTMRLNDHTMRLEEIKTELAKRPTIENFENWRESKVEPLERDVDKLKFLHKNEWKNLPDSGTVSRILVGEGIKVNPTK